MIAPDLDTAMARLQDMVQEASVILPFTGAGISTECGIPDFRSPGGIWTKNRPIPFDEFLASQEARNESWRRRFAMGDEFGQAKPGRGHRALASLYRAGKVPAVVTQNIDNLHQASGIAPEHVVELHGNTTYALCLDCERALRNRVGAPADGIRQWLRARLSELRRPHQDRDGIIRSSDAGFRNAACPGSHLVLRSIPGDRFLARGLAGGRISLDGQAQRRPTDHHQPRADRLRRHRRPRGAAGHRHGAGAVRRLHVIHRCSQVVTLLAQVLQFCAFPADGECYL